MAPSRLDPDFTTPDYYHRIGRTLERGNFDFVFFADLLAVPTRFGGDMRRRCAAARQATATLDPLVVAASIARGHLEAGRRDHQVHHVLSPLRAGAHLRQP